MSFLNNLHIGLTSPENDAKIADAGRISELALRISVGILFGLAAIAVILRTVTRIYTLRRVNLDDAFLWFALLCLSAATGLFYHLVAVDMLEEAIAVVPDVVVPIGQLGDLLGSVEYQDAFLCLIWTCTFSVKASFLALFRLLIKRVSRGLTIYFWIVAVYTLLTWMFVVSEVFILCPYFGLDQAKCYPQDNYPKTLGLTILITVLDTVSDVMIASIPIVILSRSRMKTSQKFSLAVFLCLSLVMAILAVIRCAGIKVGPVVDLNWTIYWQYMEGCIACIMASVTPFRILFVNFKSRTSGEKKRGPSYSLRDRLLRKTKRSNGSDWAERDSPEALPQIPGPVLTGLRTFIRRNNRAVGQSTVMMSSSDPLDEEMAMKSDRGDRIYVVDRIDVESNRLSIHDHNRATRGRNFL